jgi:hypothetical protein
MSSTDGVFDVEEIIGCRDNTERGHLEYLIKWVGFDEKHNSWEPAANLNDVSLELAREYKEKMDGWYLPLPSPDYRRQARQLLLNTFQRVSCAAIDKILSLCQYNFTRSFHYTSFINHQRTNNGDGAGQFDLIPEWVKVFIKKNRQKTHLEVTDETLLGELDDIPALNMKEVGTPTKQRAATPKKLLEPAIDLTADSSDDDEEEEEKEEEKECRCCFVDYPVSALKQCSAGEGHCVCRDCIQRYVSEQLDGNGSTVFKCIATPDCSCEYPLAFLDQILSPTLKKRANEMVALEEIKKAGEDDETLWQCPTCAHMGFVDGKPPWILCPVCNLTYCTSCNANHTDRTCEEFRREQVIGKDPKHLAAEAMSRACKRSCPHCGREFMKTEGCNKMKCKCGMLSCYLCGEKISGYSHFCNTMGCPCGDCKLWTSREEMERIDREKRQEAGREVLQGIVDEEEIDAILSSLDEEEDDQSVDTAAAVHRGEAGNQRAAAAVYRNPPDPPQGFVFGAAAAAPQRAAPPEAAQQEFIFGAAANRRAEVPNPPVAAALPDPQQPFHFPQFNFNGAPVQVAPVQRNQQQHNVNQLAENFDMMGLGQRYANGAPGGRQIARVDDVNGDDLLRSFHRLLDSARVHANAGREREMNADLQRARVLAERPDARLTHGIKLEHYQARSQSIRRRLQMYLYGYRQDF